MSHILSRGQHDRISKCADFGSHNNNSFTCVGSRDANNGHMVSRVGKLKAYRSLYERFSSGLNFWCRGTRM